MKVLEGLWECVGESLGGVLFECVCVEVCVRVAESLWECAGVRGTLWECGVRVCGNNACEGARGCV